MNPMDEGVGVLKDGQDSSARVDLERGPKGGTELKWIGKGRSANVYVGEDLEGRRIAYRRSGGVRSPSDSPICARTTTTVISRKASAHDPPDAGWAGVGAGGERGAVEKSSRRHQRVR